MSDRQSMTPWRVRVLLAAQGCKRADCDWYLGGNTMFCRMCGARPEIKRDDLGEYVDAPKAPSSFGVPG